MRLDNFARKLTAVLLAGTLLICGCGEPEKTAVSAGETERLADVTDAGTTAPDTVTDTEAEAEAQTSQALSDWLEKALIPEPAAEELDLSELSCEDMSGNTFSGESFGDCELTLIDCWATYCMPCRDSLPVLGQLSKELPENVRLMGICLDGKAETDACRTLVSQNGVDFTQLLWDYENDSAKLTEYIEFVPTMLFVNGDGRVVATFVGAPVTDELDELSCYGIIVENALKTVRGEE